MFYQILKFLANLAIRVYFKRIEVTGMHHLPKSGPLLIACNHPGGFLEPIIMACLFDRPLHFMVRGDVFRKHWLRPILLATNQIPIFRFKDGYSNMKRNRASMAAATDAMKEGAALLIFIEGGTNEVKTLRPFQKGLARMAYVFHEETGKDIPILPVGINFLNFNTWRGTVYLNINKPISTKGFWEDKTDAEGIKKLTDKIYNEILPLTFHVTSKEKQNTLNQLLRTYAAFSKNQLFGVVDDRKSIFSTLKDVCNDINKRPIEEVLQIQDNLVKEFNNLKEIKSNQKASLLSFVLSILLSPFALIGFSTHALPLKATQMLANSVLDEDNQIFRGSILMCGGTGIFTFYYVFLLIILMIFFGLYGLLFLLLMFVFGVTYLIWLNAFRKSFLKNKYTLDDAALQRLKYIHAL